MGTVLRMTKNTFGKDEELGGSPNKHELPM
jgi:hypothetical protein